MNPHSPNFKIATQNASHRLLSVGTQTLLLLAALWLLVPALRAQTTNIFYTGFETQYDLDNWYTDYGYWEIGVSTYGPPTNALGRRAYSGTNCAATVLDGDYDEDRSSHLISPPIVVPGTNQNPRLRFWHWWSFGGGDWGQVQISTNDGATWTALSPQFSATSNDLWTRPLFDLKAYAGRTVRIAFYFESHNSGWPNYTVSVGPGWYVDEVVVETGPWPTWPAGTVESFENAGEPDAWVADYGVWQVGQPTSGPGTNSLGLRAHAGTNCLATVLAGDYPEDRSSRISGPAFVVPTAGQNPRLRFWHWWSFNNNDWGQVQISTNNGASWDSLSPVYSATSADLWTRPIFDLSAYAGKTVKIGFYFESHNSGWPNYYTYVSSGWYLDELLVETGPWPTWPTGTVEGFENAGAPDAWVADYGVWQVGQPTSGPATNSLGFRAHAGTNCLATVLAGDYPEDRSSRISGPAFVVPTAGQNPRLRFWHWWSFNNNDWGQVQITTNNGATWQALSPVYSTTSADLWTRPMLDLSAYAGKTVKIGFYFESHNSGWPNYYTYVSSGWYLDELMVETGPQVLLNPEGFELGWGSWAADFGIWEIGVPTSGPPTNASGQRAYEGTNCAATVLGGSYPEDRSSRLSSPEFIVPPAVCNPQLRFQQWWSFANNDWGQLQISTNNGASWIPLGPVLSNTSGNWTRPLYSLKAFAGLKVRLGFYFESHNSGWPNYYTYVSSGWYIDDVRLIHDFAALLLDSPVVRTQNSACVSLGLAASSSPSVVGFTIQAPAGRIANLAFTSGGCWSGAITPISGSEWAVSLTNNCPTNPMGVVTVGSICLTATSAESAFVPLDVSNLAVMNKDGSAPPVHSFGSRAVLIADRALLEASLGVNKQRMVTVFGKANTTYEIGCSTSLAAGSMWTPSWTNIVPASLYYTCPVQGALSNAPALFLRAKEQ